MLSVHLLQMHMLSVEEQEEFTFDQMFFYKSALSDGIHITKINSI